MAVGDNCFSDACDKKVGRGRSKYCSQPCAKRMAKKRAALKDRLGDTTVKELALLTARRGKYYDEAKKRGLEQAIIHGYVPDGELGKAIGCDRRTIGTIRAALVEDLQIAEAAGNWVPDTAESELEDFPKFRAKFFRDAAGEPYETRDFHLRWIKAILKAIAGGERLMILSPPRHGKTDLLTHFCVWQIVRNPNIRIGWVGGNEDIAKMSVTAVMDHLENNETLLKAYLPPGQSFKPASRSGKSWSNSMFTVANRTVTGIKSPTMVALGRGGRILSRDMDLIIADDIEDFQSTAQPGARAGTRNWMTTTLSSRKEEFTGLIIIGSRQNSDDLYGHLLENSEWNTIVEEAHSSTCVIPQEHEPQHTDCVLWPKKRTYKWLMQQKRAASSEGGEGIFDMVYLNKPTIEGLTVFSKEALELCKNPNRVLGEIPKGISHLVAGLDPADTGYQAAWLWGFDIHNSKQYVIDIENQQGGGVIAADKTIRKWHEMYGLHHWVVEENNFNKAIRQDRVLKQFTEKENIRLEGHETHKNKWDPKYGVTAMARMFNNQHVDIPWGDPPTRNRMEVAIRQFLNFSGEANSRVKQWHKSDLVMASWFPQKVYLRMTKEMAAKNAKIEYTPSYGGYSANEWNEVPW